MYSELGQKNLRKFFAAEQAMMDQFADTLAVRVFLKMANLPYRLEQRQNAYFMSPTG